MKMGEEDQEQRKLILWLQYNKIEYFAVPNQGYRNRLYAAKLKLLGVRAGVPDIILIDIPYGPRRTHEGLSMMPCPVAIEMKKPEGGRLNKAQKEMIPLMESKGWHIIVGHGADDAIKQLKALGFGG